MATTTTTQLLLPGETAWEIWTLQEGAAATLNSSHAVRTASEVEKFPAGDLIFLFPVRALTALPIRVNTDDTSLFTDLAATHAERAGLKPDPLAGQLSDIFPVEVTPEGSILLSIILRAPHQENLPTKSPSAFEISARAFPAEGETITLWRELGQWVFAFHMGGKLIYCQTTVSNGSSPDTNLTKEIRIAAAQLSVQGIEFTPSAAVIWSSDQEISTEPLAGSLSIPTSVEPRPNPVLPSPRSTLLPADVRAARRAAGKRRNTIVAIAATVLIYLAVISYFGLNLWMTSFKTKQIAEEIKSIAPESEIYSQHIAKWDELEYAISLEYNTVDILKRIASSIPPNSGLRLRSAEISPTDIRLNGEAPQPQAVNQFSLNLNRNNDLVTYDWQTPEPKQSNRGWEFNFNASSERLLSQ